LFIFYVVEPARLNHSQWYQPQTAMEATVMTTLQNPVTSEETSYLTDDLVKLVKTYLEYATLLAVKKANSGPIDLNH
jgi:hypothetical protein